jgi:citrate synthase
VEAFVQQLDRSRNISAAISDRLRRGEAIEGFGHRLYPRGDPRAAILLEMLGSRFGKSRELRLMRDIASAVEEILGEKPTIDFALVALSRVLSLPDGSPLALFALGRTMGWIAHALEQYQLGSMIRPRAKYVGPMCHPEQGERSR